MRVVWSTGRTASAQVVVHDRRDAPVPAAEQSALDARLTALPHVLAVDPPRVSTDRTTVLLTVPYDVPVTHRDLMGHAEPLETAVAPTRAAGLQVALGGELPATAEAPVKGTGELIGIAAALITLLCGVMAVSPGAPMVASMVGPSGSTVAS